MRLCIKSQGKYVLAYKNSGVVLSKLKDIGYQATSVSTYDFSTLYTTLPHNLIKEKLIDLIERPFYERKVSYTLLVMIIKSVFHFERPL